MKRILLLLIVFTFLFGVNSTVTTEAPVKTKTELQKKVATQCIGIAKSTKQQCKNKTKNTNGYCYIHKDQAPDYVKPVKVSYTGRCTATTQKGTQCKRNSATGSYYCWQHKK
jgi:outer membrane receptor for monomeric catechols